MKDGYQGNWNFPEIDYFVLCIVYFFTNKISLVRFPLIFYCELDKTSELYLKIKREFECFFFF